MARRRLMRRKVPPIDLTSDDESDGGIYRSHQSSAARPLVVDSDDESDVGVGHTLQSSRPRQRRRISSVELVDSPISVKGKEPPTTPVQDKTTSTDPIKPNSPPSATAHQVRHEATKSSMEQSSNLTKAKEDSCREKVGRIISQLQRIIIDEDGPSTTEDAETVVIMLQDLVATKLSEFDAVIEILLSFPDYLVSDKSQQYHISDRIEETVNQLLLKQFESSDQASPPSILQDERSNLSSSDGVQRMSGDSSPRCGEQDVSRSRAESPLQDHGQKDEASISTYINTPAPLREEQLPSSPTPAVEPEPSIRAERPLPGDLLSQASRTLSGHTGPTPELDHDRDCSESPVDSSRASTTSSQFPASSPPPSEMAAASSSQDTAESETIAAVAPVLNNVKPNVLSPRATKLQKQIADLEEREDRIDYKIDHRNNQIGILGQQKTKQEDILKEEKKTILQPLYDERREIVAKIAVINEERKKKQAEITKANESIFAHLDARDALQKDRLKLIKRREKALAELEKIKSDEEMAMMHPDPAMRAVAHFAQTRGQPRKDLYELSDSSDDGDPESDSGSDSDSDFESDSGSDSKLEMTADLMQQLYNSPDGDKDFTPPTEASTDLSHEVKPEIKIEPYIKQEEPIITLSHDIKQESEDRLASTPPDTPISYPFGSNGKGKKRKMSSPITPTKKTRLDLYSMDAAGEEENSYLTPPPTADRTRPSRRGSSDSLSDSSSSSPTPEGGFGRRRNGLKKATLASILAKHGGR